MQQYYNIALELVVEDLVPWAGPWPVMQTYPTLPISLQRTVVRPAGPPVRCRAPASYIDPDSGALVQPPPDRGPPDVPPSE